MEWPPYAGRQFLASLKEGDPCRTLMNNTIPTVYVSGLSNVTDFSGAAAAGVPIGVQVQEISRRVESLMVEYNSGGGKLFVDSGAFTACRKKTNVDFDKIMDRYDSLAAKMEFPELVAFVAPDVIGDMDSTANLQQSYRIRLKNLSALGAELLVPFQKGWKASAYQAHYYWLRDNIGSFTLAFACNEHAWNVRDIATIVNIVNPDRVHLLGAGKKYVLKYFEAIQEVFPKTIVSSDANRVRSYVGEGRFITECVKVAALGAAEIAEKDFDGSYDETEIIYDLYNTPGYLSPKEAVQLAKQLGITNKKVLDKWAAWSQEASEYTDEDNGGYEEYNSYGSKLGHLLTESCYGYDIDLLLVKSENGSVLRSIFSTSIVKEAKITARSTAIRECMVKDQTSIAKSFEYSASQLSFCFNTTPADILVAA